MYFTILENNVNVRHYLKRTEIKIEVVNPYHSLRFAADHLSLVCQAQASLGAS